ncbi:MAG: tetratricopeptide repeat protein [Candidatus Krumholzibacteriia bacterium]
MGTRFTDRRLLLPGLLFLTLMPAAYGLGGCRDEAGPQTDLDRFVARYEALPPEVREDSLRARLADPGVAGTYARFQLGNLFYGAAVDSARERGWNDPATAATLDSAQVHLETAVARDSSFVEALVNLGSIWDDRANVVSPGQSRQEAMARSEQLYLTALRQSPTDVKARCNLGSLYLRQRRTMDAKREFLTALEHDPESALAHYNLAIMFAEAKIYREAIREWELAAKYDRDGDIGSRSRDNVEIVKQLRRQDAPRVQH